MSSDTTLPEDASKPQDNQAVSSHSTPGRNLRLSIAAVSGTSAHSVSNETSDQQTTLPLPPREFPPHFYTGLSMANSLASLQSYHTATAVPWPYDPSRTLPVNADQGANVSSAFWSAADGGLVGWPGSPQTPGGSWVESEDYEVVLDDGTRQKRSVSLSTLPALSPTRADHHHWRRRRHRSVEPDETTALLWEEHGQGVSDSDGTFDHVTKERPLRERWRSLGRYCVDLWQARPLLSDNMRKVMKCSFAYVLAASLTFIPKLNALLGNAAPMSSTVATVILFFNPAKSIGSMVEYVMFALATGLSALVVCLLSQFTALYFRDRSYMFMCILTLGGWIATSVLVLSFVKAHAATRPSISTGCGLASMIIFPVLVRQGAPDDEFYHTDNILALAGVILLGVMISAWVCIVIWPTTASRKLRDDIDGSLTSTRILLKLLTKTFLMDKNIPSYQANDTLTNAIKSHRAAFTSLQANLEEARHEFLGGYDNYCRIVESLQRLAQHISGLRSSCGLQFDSSQKNRQPQWSFRPEKQQRKRKSSSFMEHALSIQHPLDAESENPHTPFPEERKVALNQFIGTVRRPMKSLAYTCKQTILHLQAHFAGRTTAQTPSFELMKNNLSLAMTVFDTSQHHALMRMYRRYRDKSEEDCQPDQLHSHLIQQFPADDVFIVYAYVFCLLEFAKELIKLVDHVQDVFEPHSSGWFSCCFGRADRESTHATLDSRSSFFKKEDGYVPNNHNTTNTLHTPAPRTRWRGFFLRLWSFLSWFRQHTVRFAVKSTLISVALASMAFIPATQAYFKSLRMEWTLVTVMAVMTPTVGGTNLVAVLRVLATVVGCLVAVIVYTCLPDMGVPLLIVSWLFSIPCFWVVLNHRHGRFGQFSLLAYNLVTLSKFNQRNENIIVHQLAWMRCAAVSAGVIIGLVVTTYIWPFEARKELRKGLSDFMLRLSWLYKQLVGEHGAARAAVVDHPWASMTDVLERRYHWIHQLEKIELALQFNLIRLRELLSYAPNEPRLKGPFPVETYDAMLTSCQDILDRFLAIRVVVLKDVWLQVQQTFVLPTCREWMAMTGNVLLYFYVLASALQLKTPLPPFLPPAEQARQALLTTVQKNMVSVTREPRTPFENIIRDECFIAFYAYIVTMDSIIVELDEIGLHMKDLFGTLVAEEQWSTCFGLLDPEQGRFE